MADKAVLIRDFSELSRLYPALSAQDFLKAVSHAAFGPKHLAKSEEAFLFGIRAERERGEIAQDVPVRLGDYVRVPLSLLDEGLSEKTLARLLYLTAQKPPETPIDTVLSAATDAVKESAFSFSAQELSRLLDEWQAQGFLPPRHTQEYHAAHRPAYRVVSSAFLPWLSLFCFLDRALERGAVRLAVEGPCCAGKSTLAALLKEVYGATVIRMDDFFLRPAQRTPQRLSTPGENVDHERLLSQVLRPLAERGRAEFAPFDCKTQRMAELQTVKLSRLTVIEGVYSMHPSLRPFYNGSLFLTVEKEEQRRRVLSRSPQLAERFFREWIPMEDAYFKAFSVLESCDLVL